jgi:hypothetical protein
MTKTKYFRVDVLNDTKSLILDRIVKTYSEYEEQELSQYIESVENEVVKEITQEDALKEYSKATDERDRLKNLLRNIEI